jgi:hypothetical protein
MTLIAPPINTILDSDGFPPIPLGVAAVKFGTFTFATAANTGLFYLPYNAEPVAIWYNVSIVFNAATTNTLDIGITGTATYFATALALGSLGQITSGFAVNRWGLRLAAAGGPTVVTVRYNQTGTAATTGTATLFVEYIVRG